MRNKHPASGTKSRVPNAASRSKGKSATVTTKAKSPARAAKPPTKLKLFVRIGHVSATVNLRKADYTTGEFFTWRHIINIGICPADKTRQHVIEGTVIHEIMEMWMAANGCRLENTSTGADGDSGACVLLLPHIDFQRMCDECANAICKCINAAYAIAGID